MRVLFVDGTKGHNPRERISRPTGGILNSLTLIPEYLASKGHDVYVRSTFNQDVRINGVQYITEEQHIPKWDVTVFNRDVLPRDFVLYCKQQGIKCVWWLHDIVQTTYLKDNAFMQMDKIVALSEYCKKTYRDFYELPESKFAVIPNGVDKALFHSGPWEDRDPKIWLMASALVKGFQPIPTVFDNLSRIIPDLDFRIYSSQKLHGLDDTDNFKKFLAAMEQAGAHVYSPTSPEVLAHLMRKAWCLLMPNSYPEICSNLLIQAQASGCPVITSQIGSAPEFIQNRNTGLLTKEYLPHDQYSWIVEYTNLALELSLDKGLHRTISEEAPKGTLDWNQIGGMWDELLQVVVQ